VIGGSQPKLFSFTYIFEDLLTSQNLPKAAKTFFHKYVCVLKTTDNLKKLFREMETSDWIIISHVDQCE